MRKSRLYCLVAELFLIGTTIYYNYGMNCSSLLINTHAQRRETQLPRVGDQERASKKLQNVGFALLAVSFSEMTQLIIEELTDHD